MKMLLYGLMSSLFFTFACGNNPSANVNSAAGNSNLNNTKTTSAPVPVYTYEIVNKYKHDSQAFTQGLVFHEGFLYEGTGEYGESSVRKIELETGKVLQKKNIDKQYFGEGISLLNGKIYQITWQENTAFVYDLNDFKKIKEIGYEGSGWGLTNDGTNLIMSDGTHILKFLDPETFKPVRSIAVKKDDGKPLYHLNELEYVKGEIWANIWHSEDAATTNEHGHLPNLAKPNHIARIDPQTGNIVGWIDLGNISPSDEAESSENTLNGIAYDAAGDRIFVTGKKWKNLFEIKLKPKQ